jgi:hypothetical protein
MSNINYLFLFFAASLILIWAWTNWPIVVVFPSTVISSSTTDLASLETISLEVPIISFLVVPLLNAFSINYFTLLGYSNIIQAVAAKIY